MATIVALSSFSVAGAQAPRAGQRRSPVGVSPRRHALVVRCHSEPEMQPPEDTAPATPSAPASASDPSAPQPSPAPKKPQTTKVSTKFWDVLAFRGPAPERINGRLAMVGFVSALAVEAARGDGLLEQVGNGGAAWFVGTAAVLSVASLVPLLRGESVQDRSEGLMNAEAELWNGRFAMLGLVALAFTEFLKGGPLV